MLLERHVENPFVDWSHLIIPTVKTEVTGFHSGSARRWSFSIYMKSLLFLREWLAVAVVVGGGVFFRRLVLKPNASDDAAIFNP